MLTAYIQSAMRYATYEILDDQTFMEKSSDFKACMQVRGPWNSAAKNCNPRLKVGSSSASRSGWGEDHVSRLGTVEE